MEYKNIIFEKKDGIGYVTMNRPKALNALNTEVLTELDDVFRAIDKDDEPVIVEVNLDGPGSVFYQYANGPFFGNRTENVIEWCKAQAWKPNVRIQMI